MTISVAIERMQLASNDDGTPGILKEVLRAGQVDAAPPLHPAVGDTVEVDYTGRLADGSVFDSSKNPGRDRFKFVLGKGQVIRGWDIGVASMCKGETCRLTLSPEYAYGPRGAPPSIPPNATLVFDVELHDWKEAADLTGDGSIKKYVVAEADQDKLWQPVDGDTAVIRYEDEHENERDAAASGHVDRMEKFTVGDANDSAGIPPGMHVAVKTMRLNEVAKVVIDGESRVVKLLHIFKPTWIVKGKVRLIRIEEVDRKWQQPNAGSVVRLGLSWGEQTGVNISGTHFDFEVDAGQAPSEMIELAVMQMKETEKVILEVLDHTVLMGCHNEQLVSYVTDEVAKSGVASLSMSLEKLERSKECWEMCDEERIAAAVAAKQRGNDAWKCENTSRAVAQWERAKKYLSSTDDHAQDGKVLLKAIEMNLAAGYLKLDEPRKARKLLGAVLEGDPKNVKALFRRAETWMATKDFAEARMDIKTAQDADPENVDIKRLAHRLSALEASAAKREAALYGRMFG